jgi:hypothetical protein
VVQLEKSKPKKKKKTGAADGAADGAAGGACVRGHQYLPIWEHKTGRRFSLEIPR